MNYIVRLGMGVLVICLFAGVRAPVVQTKDPVYRLRPANTVEDQEACAKDKGKGALVFELAENGDQASQMESFCLVPTK